MQKPCRVCGEMFTPKQQRSTLCSRACERRAGKPCTIEDCEKPTLARGMCSTHYNRLLNPNRHPKVTVPCGWCGKPHEKERATARGYTQRFCSSECWNAWYRSSGTEEANLARARAAHVSPLYAARRRAARAARGTSGGGQVLVAGDCHSCGMAFVGIGVRARYCSPLCAKREKNHRKSRRHRMNLRQGQRIPYSRVDIYRRDGWRCHLCKGRVRRDVHYLHPEAPTIDHLIPVARGGDDVPSNVMCAHRSCNSKRGTGGTVQLLLLG